MPEYEYFCNKEDGGCGSVFSEVLSIGNRNVPTTEPCPACEKVGTVRKGVTAVNPPSLISNAGGKMDPAVRARLDRIKSENPDMKTRILD